MIAFFLQDLESYFATGKGTLQRCGAETCSKFQYDITFFSIVTDHQRANKET